MPIVLLALSLSPAWARSIQIQDRPLLARCVAQLFSNDVSPSDDAALVTGVLNQLKDDRAKVDVADDDLLGVQNDLLPDAGVDFQRANKTLIDQSFMRLRQLLANVAAKDAVSVVHVRRGPEEIGRFLDQMDALTDRVDQKFRGAKVRRFGIKETVGKFAALAAAVGAGWLAHRHGLTSDGVFRATTVFPALVTGFYMTLRRATDVMAAWRNVPPTADARRLRFDSLVGAIRGALNEAPRDRPRTLHFGTHHVFTPDFAKAMRQAQTLDQVPAEAYADLARSRRHLVWSYLREITSLQTGSVDYVYTSATADQPATLITVATLRRWFPVTPPSSGGRGGPTRGRPAPDAGLAPAI